MSKVTMFEGRLTLEFSDAVLAPGETGQRVNSGLVWVRLDSKPWSPTGHRSLHKAVRVAESFVDPEEAFAEITETETSEIL